MTNRSDTRTSASPSSPDLASIPLLHSRTLQQAPARWPDGEDPRMRRAYDAELARQQRGGK